MEDGSTDPDRAEPHPAPSPPADENMHDQRHQHEETTEKVNEHNERAAFSDDDAKGDDSAVGHEVAPPHARTDADDIGYYARLQPDEEDLADNVASDVRRVPSARQRQLGEESGSGSGHAAPDYEEMTTPHDNTQGDQQRVSETGESVSAGTAATPHQNSAETLPAEAVTTTQSTTLARQPCHGTQVDAEADMPMETERAGGVEISGGLSHSVATRDAAPTVAPPSSVTTLAAAVAAAPPPRWSLLPQAAHGTVKVSVTLLPVQALTCITVPVHNPNLYRLTPPPPPSSSPNSYAAGGPDLGEGFDSDAVGSTATRDGGASNNNNNPSTTSSSPYWVLVAKELFEVLAQHLSLHPESFYIFHQNKRLRFMGTLFLDCDVTSSSLDAAGAAAPTENTRAEPLWVSVVFPAPRGGAAGGAAGGHPQLPFPTTSHGAGDDVAEEAQASLANVPAHLVSLGPHDYVARCIRVRRRKVQIPPRTLVDGRRQGYSYDEVIQQMQSVHDAAAAEEGGDGKEKEASNFTVIAVVQDGPTPPAKPFLGGYRDKRLAGHVLLHAATQLYHRDLQYSPFAKSGAAGAADRSSRQTQTFGISRSCQTHREACAQTPRSDLLLDTSHDFVVVARPYFSAAALQGLQEEMAVVIQKLYRQWKARRVRGELEAAEAARKHRAGERQRREEALHAAVEDAARLRRDDPRSAADFERVRQDIIAWRTEEATRIQRDPTLSATDARSSLLAISRKELQLLQQLDQRRREVGKTREEATFVHNLDRMAAPKQWGTVHVVTPETVRAGELRDLYERLVYTSGAAMSSSAVPSRSARTVGSGISSGSVKAGSAAGGALLRNTPQSSGGTATVPHSERSAATLNASCTPALTSSSAADGLSSATATRLDILLRVKWTVREFHAASALARELGELIDREADLLHRGRKDASLSGLRKRIQTLFAQFIEDPEYNPGLKDFVQTARGRARVKAVETEKAQQQTKTQRSRA
jgi:hypothetical protein